MSCIKKIFLPILIVFSFCGFAFTNETIAQKDTLTIAVHEDMQLLMYTENGESKGFCPELVTRIAELKNLTIKYKIFGSNVIPTEIAKDAEVDFVILSPLFQSEEIQKNCTKEFFLDNFVSITQEGAILNPQEKIKIGLIKIHAVNEPTFKKALPHCEFVYFDDLQSVLRAVSKGDVKIGVCTEARADYLLRSPYFKNLVMNNTLVQPYGMALWATNTKSQAYIPTINDGVDLLFNDFEQRIIRANIKATPYDYSTLELVYKYQLEIVLFILILLLLGLLYMGLKIENKKLHTMNKQLQCASEKAMSATNAKSVFLANMSHELRTPLNAILGLNTLLKDSLDDRDLAEDYIAKTEQSSKILLSIINDILDVSAIENNKLKISHEPFNIQENVHMITELYYQQSKQKGIKYSTVATNITHEVLIGDSYRIRQILLNLLSNALKFTEKNGSITVKLSENTISDTQTMLQIEVADTGCGMSNDLQKRLFNKFEQEDATTVTKYGGSGLGLSITKSLIEMMDGTISVESSLGKGTVFNVSIPLSIGNSVPLGTSSDISHLHILIIDDDIDTCKYLCVVTQKWGITSEYVLNPYRALEMVKEKNAIGNPYNAYLIDIKMPQLNGIELAIKIEALATTKMKIIMMSGYDISDFKEQTKGFNIDCFLQKPIFPSELFNTIISNLGEKNNKIEGDPTEDEISLKDMQILLAEDNAINQLIATRLLESKQAIVTVANNGQEAVDLITNKKTKYNIVLMDVQMPIMDGYEATKKIRSIDSEYTKNLLIYAMTANSFKSDVEKALESGMNGHIAKPIDPKCLFRLLSEVFN